MNFEIVEVNNPASLSDFIHLPFTLYKGNPYWAPPLKSDEKSYLKVVPRVDESLETKMFLAKDSAGMTAGRIQVILNSNEIKFLGEVTARFYKFDFIDDIAVSKALLEAAEKWAKSRKAVRMTGPFGYSNLDVAGYLSEGFDMLTGPSKNYNFPYYTTHLETHGYHSYLEWLEHEFIVPEKIPDRVVRMSALIRKRYGLRIVSFDTKAEKQLRSRQILNLVNICYTHLPGFVPLSDELKDFYFQKYMPLVNKDFIALVADENNDLIGFGLTIPSYDSALKKANGSIFPLGFYYLWNAGRHNDRAELLLLAVHPDYQHKGVPSLIFEEIIRKYKARGIKYVDASPQQAENTNLLNLWKEYDYQLHKRRLCYEKTLG